MRIRTVALGLFFMSSAALAGWSKISNEEFADKYTDDSSVVVDGDVRYVWNLTNFKQPLCDGKSCSQSLSVLYKYDCAEKTSLVIYLMEHEGPMGQGNVLTRAKGSLSDTKRQVPGKGEYDWLMRACKIKS